MCCSNAVPVIETMPATVSGLIATGVCAKRGGSPSPPSSTDNDARYMNARMLLCSDENEIPRPRYGLTRRRSGSSTPAHSLLR